MSKFTPRTDSAEYSEHSGGSNVVPAWVARELETELAEARAEIERLQEWEDCMKTQAPYEAAGATWEQRHKQDQKAIDARDKLIEQMRDALNHACQQCVNHHAERLSAVCGACEIKSALRAADGGE